MQNICKFKVKLVTTNDVKEFSQTASNCPRNVMVKVMHNGFIVDAKSILGLFSLNLSNEAEMNIEFPEDISSEEISKCVNTFEKWRVD